MTDAYTCYIRYLALKNHFTKWDYDYFTYRGYVKATRETFEKRRDLAQFYTLAKKKKPLDVLLANLSSNPQKSLREINQDSDAYLDYQRRIYSLSYLFKTEIQELDPVWEENFIVRPGRHPLLMRAFLGGRISLETGSIALALSGHTENWKKACTNDVLFSETVLRMIKYEKFLGYKKDVFQQLIVDCTIQDDKYSVTV